MVLLRTTQTRPIDSKEDFHTGCRNVSHNQQRSFSGLHKPDPATLQKTFTRVVETLVTTNNIRQDYTNPDYQPTTGFKIFNVLCSMFVTSPLKKDNAGFTKTCTAKEQKESRFTTTKRMLSRSNEVNILSCSS